ncbi:Ig-like domain repeat protein [Edaphobacter acidisoli]|uniref:Ig-like domain repeat protein n=1 Tax=Edaphobacter acidisoli TaxID=2040573 RepID=UPI00166E057F|nr:Ig-like domain repeat protein [Edaphobacter acidisoli]
MDFTFSGTTCGSGPYVTGQTCSVSVEFTPKYPGMRFGAVVMIATDGHIMASQRLSGVGIGSLSVILSGIVSTVAGNGCVTDVACRTSGSTPATQGSLNLPIAVATDGGGDIYISDTANNRIRKVDTLGNITTIAGASESAGFSGDGGPALTAQINTPSTIVIDGAGNIFFSDVGNDAVREINVATGNISTIAGTLGTAGFSGDNGPATAALLSAPEGLAFDANGNLYIADTGNNRIREIDTNGTITTAAGDGSAAYAGDGGPAVLGELNQPWGITVSIDGNLYIADSGNNRIRAINLTTGLLSTVAGSNTASYFGDGGQASHALFNSPTGVTADAAGNLYVADHGNSAIRKINYVSGMISTIAGNGTGLFSGDGSSANRATLNFPYSMIVDQAGNLLIPDYLDLRVRKISAVLSVISYPTMKEGKTSEPMYQGIENDGNAPLNFSNLMATGTTSATLDFNPSDPLTTTCSTSQALSVGSTCTLGVEFAPVNVESPAAGTLYVSSDSGNSPIGVDLSGNVLSVDPTSTTVTSGLNPASVGMAVTFTAFISSPNRLTGTVQFYDGSTAIGAPQPVDPNSSTATLTTSFTVPQTHNISGVYSGDDYDAVSTPNTPVAEIIQQATALNVIPSANPVTVFAPLSFSAKLTGGTTPPAGSIVFMDGATSLGSVALDSNGNASFTAPPLAVGTHTIIAKFAGDSNDFPSQYQLSEIVDLASSVTMLGTNTAIAKYSTPITFTATVTGVSSSTPTGNVEFMDGANILGAAPLSTLGSATYVNSALSAGTHTITAVYEGDADYSPSTSTQIITETIWQVPTVTVLSASATNSTSGAPITLTAIVAAQETTVPTGTVKFMNGNILLGTGTLSNGKATITTTNLGVGMDSVTAIYNGDSNDEASESSAVAITVVQAPTTTTISSSQTPLPTLTPVVVAASVSNGSAQIPTGLVTFSEDSVAIGVGQLDSTGVATISLQSLPAGSHTFVASYAGDMLDVPSVSAPFTQTVQPRSTTNVLTTSSTSLTGGQQVTLISVISPAGPPPSTAPTGNVTFMSGNTTLATSPVDATGVATVTAILPGTSAEVSSVYSGDANYSSSTSSPVEVAIGPAPDFNLEATPSSWSMQSKQHLTLKLTLASVKNFTGAFSLGCLGLPQNATCTFSENQPMLPAGGTQSVDVTVDTGSPLLGGTQARTEQHTRSDGTVLCLLPGAIVLGVFGLRKKRMRPMKGLFIALISLGLFTTLSGCGSITSNGTPPGTYHFLITATGPTGISQFVGITMTITQ